MNIKGIKLMLLGIALMIFGFGVQASASFYIGDYLYYFYQHSFNDWIEAMFHYIRVIIMIVGFFSPLAGLIVTIVGFRVKDSNEMFEVVGEIVEINDEEIEE